MIQRLRVLIRKYFGFSYKEINGFLIIILVMILLIIAPVLFDKYYSPTKNITLAEKREFDSITHLLGELEINKKENIFIKSGKLYAGKNYFNFDPNSATLEQFIQLGVTEYIAKRIIKYREKGGKFRKNDDLLKIYDFPIDLYKDLIPFIQIKSSTYKALSKGNEEKFLKKALGTKSNQKLTKFDLNTADSTQLKLINGIGTGYAKRIIKYRDALGGFYNVDQVREVYGLPSSAVEELLKYAFLKSPVKKINFNIASLGELNKHPYISYQLAKVIINYRNQHGNFNSIDDLKEIKLLESDVLDKFAPYIEF